MGWLILRENEVSDKQRDMESSRNDLGDPYWCYLILLHSV